MRLNSLQFAACTSACTSRAAITSPAAYHYSRESLVALYNRDAPTAAVADTARKLGIVCLCRLRCIGPRRFVNAVRLPPRRPIHGLFVGCYRGCRGGRNRRPLVLLRPVGNGVSVITGNRPVACIESLPPRQSSLQRVHIDRHSAPCGDELVFGSLNVCSLGNKLEDLLDVHRDQSLDVMCLVETWHDSESVSLRRLR